MIQKRGEIMRQAAAQQQHGSASWLSHAQVAEDSLLHGLVQSCLTHNAHLQKK
jgi:hypothetical protein